MTIDISFLDKVIALVIVILLLSLIVQTVQSVFKKAFKIKSRQIEDSLLDLFQNALDQPPQIPAGRLEAMAEASPVVRFLKNLFHTPTAPASGQVSLAPDPEDLRRQTLRVFGQLGRLAQSGRPMLDSLAKDDLLRVLTRLNPGHLLGEGPAASALANLRMAVTDVTALAGQIQSISDDPALRGEASAKFGAFRAVVSPLITDCEILFKTGSLNAADANGKPEVQVLIQDLFALRQVRAQDALDLLGSVQEKIAANVAAAPDDSTKQALRGLADRVSMVGRAFVALQGEFDHVTAALRAKLGSVEQWFDTVMQSFDERYARGMKTWGLVVAFLVVAALNANFFHIYSAISGSERLRQHIIDQREQVGQMARKVNDLTKEAQASADAGKPEQSKAIVASINDTVKADAGQIDQAATVYSDMGFQPLSPGQIAHWWRGPWTLGWLRNTGSILLGWIVMTLLMSAGAPFWEDALESLFGIKTLLRKDTASQNVEQRSGAGQPKT